MIVRRQRVAAQEKLTAHTLIVGSRSVGNEEMWATLVTKFSPVHHTAVFAAAAVTVLASATEAEKGSAAPWRPNDEYASLVLFEIIISSRRVLTGPRNDGPRFSHLQSIIHPNIGRKEFGSMAPSSGESFKILTRFCRNLTAVLAV